ncbi:TadE/TadG family type IV pilus assembly protein [Pinisolibacter sp.]|uniref:TadE/TadG family type IV pilus assembly protein n=1 Tax=Pinisolibacter sp. TaxID=2172024 RepID=UPI002FDD84DC
MWRGPAKSTPTSAVTPAELVRRTLRRTLGSRIVTDRGAATAVEFGILALPFLALVGAIFESALCFLAGQILDTAVADAGRLIRTGQAQASGYDEAAFKTQVCNRLYVLFNCANLTIDAKIYTNFTSANTSMPIDADKNFDTSGFTFQMGGSSQIVVVRAFYPYPLYFNKLGLDLANLANGTRLLSGVSTFRNEPFPW